MCNFGRGSEEQKADRNVDARDILDANEYSMGNLRRATMVTQS
jgi:hypothetical protein